MFVSMDAILSVSNIDFSSNTFLIAAHRSGPTKYVSYNKVSLIARCRQKATYNV